MRIQPLLVLEERAKQRLADAPPLEMNFGLAAKEKPAGLRRRALINSLAV